MIFTNTSIKSLVSFVTFFVLLCRFKSSNAAAPIKIEVKNAPSAAFNAPIQHCAELASKAWNSAVETRVLLKFSEIEIPKDDARLGFARPSEYTFAAGKFMQIAAAKAVLQKDLSNNWEDPRNNPEYEDVFVTLNPNAKWYLGTDGKVPSGHYDLVSVCLHELYHGLFFSGRTNQIAGKFRLDQVGRFDHFIVAETASSRDCPLSSYKDNPEWLAKALTGNSLWFRTPENRIAKLYAPNVYTETSSLYHLDDQKKYGFMRPSSPAGEANHDIDQFVLAMQATVRNTSQVAMEICGSQAEFEPLFKKDKQKSNTTKIVAIVIIVVCGVLAVMACLFGFYLIRRWSRNRAGQESGSESGNTEEEEEEEEEEEGDHRI